MICIEEKKNCTGCHACYSICPTKAIVMNRDAEGFLYPAVNEALCVNCRKCEKVCPILSPKKADDRRVNPAAYAAQTKDEQTRRNSSSGGIFTELATCVLRQGGAVFGAAFNEDFSVSHICIETEAELEKLRGSKYVQSTIGMAYEEARRKLQTGSPVLFTGTLCQIGGLYRFLGKDYDNLYTQDIICHGVPSPMVWQKYVGFREEAVSAKLNRVFFRHKKYSWKAYCVQFEFSNHSKYTQKASDDLYMRSFLRNLCLRPSCYHCAFKTQNRVSDITLADFWGIEKMCPSLDDDRGTSLVIVHSKKGRTLFEKISNNVVCREVDLDEAVKYNASMTKSAPMSGNRDAFMQCTREKGFQQAAKRYLGVPLMSRVKNIVKAMLRKMRRLQ